MTTHREPPAEDVRARVEAIRAGRGSLDSYVQELLADKTFQSEVVPGILLQEMLLPSAFNSPNALVLKSQESPRGPVYYLRQPCAPETAEKVKPWWDLDSEILVCPDSHRPNYLGNDKYLLGAGAGSDSPIGRCESIVGSGSDPKCGCGPNVILCYRDFALRDRVRKSHLEELKQTIGYIVAQDRPIADMFTMNETMQDRHTMLEYVRWKLTSDLTREVPDFRKWPEEPVLTPREELIPGQHAGILTAPNFIFFGDGRRDRMRMMQDKIWCQKPASTMVTAHEVLNLGATTLRNGEGWELLAKRPVCTDCHARLDYGMQFFWGYRAPLIARTFSVAEQPKTPQKVYVQNINDFRTDAEGTPLGYARAAVAQPEFQRCMISRVSRFVFNGTASPEDEASMVAAYERSPTMKSLMSIALTRYAARETEPTQATILSAAEVAASTGGPRTDDVLVMNTGLAAAFDDHCSHCHDEGQYFYVDGWTFDKAQPALPRPLAVRMLTQLAYGTMPKQGMGLVERKALIERFIDALWTDEADRREARSLFLDYWDRPAAHSLSAIFGRQAHSAGLSETDTLGTRAAFAVEPYLDQDSARLNPGLLGLSALDALALCRKKHGDDAKARNQCVEELVQLPLLIKGGLEGGQR